MVTHLYIHEFTISYLGQTYILSIVDDKYNEKTMFTKFHKLFLIFYNISLMNDEVRLSRSTTTLDYFVKLNNRFSKRNSHDS